MDALKETVYQQMLVSLSKKESSYFDQPEEDINQSRMMQRKVSGDLSLIDRLLEDVGMDERGWDVYHTGSLRVSMM